MNLAFYSEGGSDIKDCWMLCMINTLCVEWNTEEACDGHHTLLPNTFLFPQYVQTITMDICYCSISCKLIHNEPTQPAPSFVFTQTDINLLVFNSTLKFHSDCRCN